MKPSFSIVARQAVQTVAGWPTDTFSVDIPQSAPPHTVLVFVPGNPGLIEWYIRSFKTIISQLGPGYAARGVSNVGASLSEELVDVETLQGNDSKRRSLCTPWTVDGQVMHKVAYMDLLRREFDHAEYIFVAHSLGAHLVTRLCVLRPDILQSTKLLLFLTPYIRMKAPPRMQAFLNMAAARPHITINVHRLAMAIMKRLSLRSVETLMSLDSGTGDDPESTKISAKLARLPLFAQNFFLLGTEEVRDIPECFDVRTLEVRCCFVLVALCVSVSLTHIFIVI